MGVSVGYLQEYIKANDFVPDSTDKYFLHLIEEVGELSRAMLGDARPSGGGVKGTVAEEIWDVMYYAIALANCYGVNLEEIIAQKERINNEKYGDKTLFEAGR